MKLHEDTMQDGTKPSSGAGTHPGMIPLPELDDRSPEDIEWDRQRQVVKDGDLRED